jgi:hypothetical protein
MLPVQSFNVSAQFVAVLRLDVYGHSHAPGLLVPGALCRFSLRGCQSHAACRCIGWTTTSALVARSA